MEGFVYVVNPPVIPRVVFGSGLERETLPLSGPCLSSFMRKFQGDLFLSPGPQAHVDKRNFMEIKYPSTLGHNAFASKLLRLPPTEISKNPCVGSYDVDIKTKKRRAYVPFNTSAKRQEIAKFLTPPPNCYSHHKARPQLQITSAFGKMRKFSPTIPILCSTFNVAECYRCLQKPLGDYWYDWDKEQSMCRSCRNKKQRALKSCSTTERMRLALSRELMNYRRVRYCGFFHDHHGTTAAIQLMSKKTLRFKITKENYLSLHM